MKSILNDTFPLFQLEESRLEEEFRTKSGCTYMIVNGYEVRWPEWTNFVGALRDGTVERFFPGGEWERIPAEDPQY